MALTLVYFNPLSKFGLSSREIQSIFNKKLKPIQQAPFTLICDQDTTEFRFAIALSKQIKARTLKQKTKRQSRALFYSQPEVWNKHHHVLIVSSSIADLTFTTIKDSFLILNKKCKQKSSKL